MVNGKRPGFFLLGFCFYLSYGDYHGLLVYSLLSIIFYFIESCSASTELLRKELSGH